MYPASSFQLLFKQHIIFINIHVEGIIQINPASIKYALFPSPNT